jgi:hypothetical protein
MIMKGRKEGRRRRVQRVIVCDEVEERGGRRIWEGGQCKEVTTHVNAVWALEAY